MIPRIRTERLVLQPLTTQLASELLAGSGPPAAAGFPSDDDQGLLARAAAHDSAEEPGHVYVLLHEQHCIGTLGVAGQLAPDGEQEFGYGLVRSARGQGLGAEAVAALCAVLERRPGTLRLTAQVEHDNSRSIRLLHKLGFTEVDGGVAGHHKLARATPDGPALLPRRITGRHVC